jgi:prepilin-type N-terminal cleavage/methylation domain-containing protein
LKHKGFSLIEIVAAVAIIAIIFSGLTTIRASQIQYARKAESEQDVMTIQEALSCYLYFHGEDPEGLEDITIETLIRRGFLRGENKSPWGIPYKLTVKDSALIVETDPDAAK